MTSFRQPHLRLARVFLMIAFSALFISRVAASDSQTAAPEFLYQNLQAQGFTCEDAPGDLGKICRVESINPKASSGSGLLKYSKPVIVLIPKNVRKPDQIILHLHGFRMGLARDRTPEAMLKDFGFLDKMKQAGATNSVMVFPVSTGNCTTFKQELAPQFQKFADWVRSEVKPAQDNWVISGHSGANVPIRQILQEQIHDGGNVLPHLKGVALLDATYNDPNGGPFDTSIYKKALAVNPDLKVYSVYRKPSADGTAAGSQKLRRDLQLTQDNVFPADTAKYPKANNHWDLVSTYYSQLLQKIDTSDSPPENTLSKPTTGVR